MGVILTALYLTFMFRTLRASFSVRAQNETWQHLKSTFVENGITFPLQPDDYLAFAIGLNSAIAALPHATWTKVDYSDQHMLAALLINIECELGIKLERINEIALAQAQVYDLANG